MNPFLFSKEIDVSFLKTLLVGKKSISENFALKMFPCSENIHICECTNVHFTTQNLQNIINS